MTEHIGRKQAIGIGKETTAGTKVNATHWLAKTSGAMMPVIETIKDTAGYGVIDEVYDVQTIRENTELSIEGTITDESFGLLLYGALGTVGISGSWPYTHAFTRNNANNHKTFTIWWSDPVGSNSSAYSMIQSLEVEAKAGEFASFKAELIGKKMVSESTPTITYASENLFRARDCKVYFADTEAGLTWATASELIRVKLNIEKNLYVHQNIGEVDIDSIFNQQLTISGDFEAVFASTTLQGYVRNGTKKFMKIELINTDVTMTPSGNPTLSFTLGKVAFESWSQTSDNNEIVKQTIGFVGAYNVDEAYSIKASMINEKSTTY